MVPRPHPVKWVRNAREIRAPVTRLAQCAILLDCFQLETRKGRILDAETIQGFDGARNPGAGHSERRGRRKDLRGVRGCVAGKLSRNRGYVRRNARGGSWTQGPAVRSV